MFSWLRRWLRSRSVQVSAPDAQASRHVSTSEPGAAPDVGEIAALYLRHLFRAPVPGGPGPREREWLGARQTQLRQQSHTLVELVPRLPSVVPRLLAATSESSRTSVRELADLIGSDPVLAANVLKVVNSPALRIRRETVTGLEQAVTIMGFSGMREAIAAATVSPIVSFDRDPRLDAEALKQLWPQTLEAAVTMRRAALRTQVGDGFECYLAGLVHSSGLATLLRCLRLLNEPELSEGFIAELHPLARRYSAAIARGWELPAATVTILERWSEDAFHDEAVELLRQAIAFTQARALMLAGVLDAARVDAIQWTLPNDARDWYDAGRQG